MTHCSKYFRNCLREGALYSAIDVQEYCKNRIEEVMMLTEALNESPFRGQAFQRLPKHMRRRQMSHNIKRLPKRLRNSTILSVKLDASGLPKRPSRKYRRRPAALLLEYNRRQRKNNWLETHIWHARRFHMTTKWGYSLPEKPTNKNFRASYRAVAKHCCITDLSYYGIIELQGTETNLLKGLQQCVSTACGLTFAAKMFKSGSREGFVTMYHPNKFPYEVIGEVSFLWKPIETENENRTIWIFTHPTVYNEITNMFKSIFSLSEFESIEIKTEDDKKTDENQKKKINYFSETPEFINKDGTVLMKLMKNKLNRFRLSGPLSLSVISNAFDPIQEVPKNQSDKTLLGNSNPLKGDSDDSDIESVENPKRMKMDDSYEDKNCPIPDDCWRKYYKTDFRKKCMDNQAKFYTELMKYHIPSDLPPGMVLSVVVRDPRYTLPTTRTKSVPENPERPCLTTIDPTLSSCSPLWEADLLQEVTDNMIPTMVINKYRSRSIVPGSDLRLRIKDKEQDKIPVMIIQRTSFSATNRCDRQDFASGFDVITPPGWAMPAWLSLIFRGARAAGLRETKWMMLEAKNLSEYIQPDSKAGECENLERYNNLKRKYFKRPPNNRPNYAKIGVDSPFYFPWVALINDWRSDKPGITSNFYVLRDASKLSELSELLGSAMSKDKSKPKKKIKLINSFKVEDMNCLVPVFVQSCGKGAPTENAMLCLPTPEDVREFKNTKASPTEDTHTDPNIKTRKDLKQKHAKVIKSMKRKRKLSRRRKADEQETNGDQEGVTSSRDVVDQYNKEMEALWLRDPLSLDTVKNSCSREIFGYVVLGGFSYSHANGAGLGYVTLRGLLQLLITSVKEDIPPLMLFRNNNRVQYRFVKIEICMNKRY